MATCRIQWTATVRYQIREVPRPSRSVILLHGFGQTGSEILAKLTETLAEDDFALAPDAPFPFPQREAGSLGEGFAWYFFDPVTNRYLNSMDAALEYLAAWYEQAVPRELPIAIAGYSQGGYLAPFLGLRLPRVERVTGINCRFRSEALPARLPFRLDAVHGSDDKLVDMERARACHGAIMAEGNAGCFQSVAGAGHGLNEAIRAAVRSSLAVRA